MKLGLYCGSFNPFHKGHLNIYHKAQKIFDRVLICQGINPGKDLQDRQPTLVIDGVSQADILAYRTLTTALIESQEKAFDSVTLIRGLRNGYDYEYEMNQIQVMRDLHPTRLQVVLIPCDREFTHISSSMIRALQMFDPKEAEKYLP